MAATGGGDHRAEIVRVATATIARDGLPALRVRAVAREVGVSHATLHYYFPTKADLVAAVLHGLIYEGIAVPLVERSTATTALDELRGVLHGVVAGYGDDARTAAMLELLRHGDADEVVASLGRYMDRWRGYLVALVARGQAAGELRADLDPDATAGLLMEFCLGAQTRAPLPDGLAAAGVEQLVSLLSV
ncbi:TetR/AcrR family transcriptional regulator [Actinomycetospora callitridis]|jgi:AcrR family transcriptional regulator|uniref:TetR/AcrR family transcriptional regulator n=1 Tax=Actinomycetospora callitridis TaxID=913944 RepID=UPI002365BD30|nr:TetR/AcrR family transcriptional regulator [Actinomycetospora callitridis]MDD7921882.1 TetR/AcrR family transcriptional regulator [Actinomycetospora callitridis]